MAQRTPLGLKLTSLMIFMHSISNSLPFSKASVCSSHWKVHMAEQLKQHNSCFVHPFMFVCVSVPRVSNDRNMQARFARDNCISSLRIRSNHTEQSDNFQQGHNVIMRECDFIIMLLTIIPLWKAFQTLFIALKHYFKL